MNQHSRNVRLVPLYLCGPQRGAALLILITIVALSMSAFLLTGTSRIQHQLDSPRQNALALSQAKESLIAYARLSDPDQSAATGLNMRYLPCPDMDGDGLEDTPCGTASAEGWLPWMSLGLAPLRDSSGTCLRYFVSSSYKQGGGTVPLLPTLPAADFTLSSTSQIISSDVVALLIAAGPVLSGQSRGASPGAETRCGSSVLADAKNQAGNYLDVIGGVDNALPPVFMTAPAQLSSTVNFNDTLLGIFSNEL